MTILRILLLAAIIIAVEVLITAVPLSIWVRRNGCKTATKVYFLKSNVSSGETFQYVLSALRRIDCIKTKRVRENRGYIKVKLRRKSRAASAELNFVSQATDWSHCFLLYPVRPLPTKYGIFS